MRIPYRTRRTLGRWTIVLLVILLAVLLACICFFLWLGRHVVYTDNGVYIDLDRSTQEIKGQPAVPPAEQETVSIYYNEGKNAVNLNTELTSISGYYITSAELKGDLTALQEQIDLLPRESAVMIEVKNAFGEFNYSTTVSSYYNSSVDLKAVDSLINRLNKSGMYTIARVTAFQDYYYGLNNVDEGLFSTAGAFLYNDDMGCYWLSPSSEQVVGYLMRIATELRSLGFDEVVFDQFVFPDSSLYRFSGDKPTALAQAAATLTENCATGSFAVSFVSTSSFTLPEGRGRLYLKDVDAGYVVSVADKVVVPDNTINLVFLTEYHDTRFDAYSVLRPITAMK